MGFANYRYNTKKIAEAIGVSESALINAMNENTYGGYARVWAVENKGNYSTARISVSKKDRNTEAYTTDFQDGYVRLVGQAHTAFQGVQIDEKKGISIKISSCEVTNVYTAPDGKVSYTPHYTIFGLEIQDGNQNNKGNNVNSVNTNNGSDGFMNIPDDIDDGELPFN